MNFQKKLQGSDFYKYPYFFFSETYWSHLEL